LSKNKLERPSDDTILVGLNQTNQSLPPPTLRPLLRKLARNPEDINTALQAANLCLQLASQTNDPRYYGFAQGALRHWWTEAEPPLAILPLRAKILQFRHSFVEARSDLERYISRVPSDFQAGLDLAILYFVDGQYKKTAKICYDLKPSINFIAIPCIAAADSMLGKLNEASTLLSQALVKWPDRLIREKSWADATLGEIYHRIGNFSESEQHFQEAIRLSPNNMFALASYADLLLELERYEVIMTMTEKINLNDTLLLRRAVAAKKLNHKEADSIAANLVESFTETRKSGNSPHLREEAWFALEIRKDAQSALARANENFQLQKEPVDVWLLARAVREAKNEKAATELRRWLAETGFRDRRVEALLLGPL